MFPTKRELGEQADKWGSLSVGAIECRPRRSRMRICPSNAAAVTLLDAQEKEVKTCPCGGTRVR